MSTNTTIIFGDTGTYKTTNLGFAARYLYEKTGKPVRLVTCEGYRTIQSFVDLGIIHVVDISAAKNPLVAFRKLSMGAWPETDPQKGKIMKMQDPDFEKHQRKVGEQFSAYFVDGLDSVAELLLEDLRDKQRKISEEVVGAFSEDDEKFGANPRSHYGFVQREMIARIKSFSSLPVERVVFTSHEAKGEEQDSKAAIRGPALVGTAATDKLGKDFGNCLHAEVLSEKLTTAEKGKPSVDTIRTTVRYYFVSHPDPKIPGVTYKCKVRLPPDKVPDLQKQWPNGFFEPTLEEGMDKFFRLEDELLVGSSGELAKWKSEVDAKRQAPTPEVAGAAKS